MCRPPPCPCCVDVTSPRETPSPGCRLPCWPGGRWRPASLTGSTWRRWLRRWMWHSGWRSRDILHLTCPSSCCDFVHCLLFTVSCSLVSLSEDVVAVVIWTMTWVPLVSHHLNVSVISGAGRGRDWRLGIVTTTTSLYSSALQHNRQNWFLSARETGAGATWDSNNTCTLHWDSLTTCTGD